MKLTSLDKSISFRSSLFQRYWMMLEYRRMEFIYQIEITCTPSLNLSMAFSNCSCISRTMASNPCPPAPPTSAASLSILKCLVVSTSSNTSLHLSMKPFRPAKTWLFLAGHGESSQIISPLDSPSDFESFSFPNTECPLGVLASLNTRLCHTTPALSILQIKQAFSDSAFGNVLEFLSQTSKNTKSCQAIHAVFRNWNPISVEDWQSTSNIAIHLFTCALLCQIAREIFKG